MCQVPLRLLRNKCSGRQAPHVCTTKYTVCESPNAAGRSTLLNTVEAMLCCKQKVPLNTPKHATKVVVTVVVACSSHTLHALTDTQQQVAAILHELAPTALTCSPSTTSNSCTNTILVPTHARFSGVIITQHMGAIVIFSLPPPLLPVGEQQCCNCAAWQYPVWGSRRTTLPPPLGTTPLP